MSNETSIVKKIIDTKRETDALKIQLQNLIDEGKNLICPSQSKSQLSIGKDEEKPLKSPNKVQIIKSYENKHSKQKTDVTIPKKTENTDHPKKTRTYDVKEAQKFIKKQKEKRIEQTKVQNEAKINAEIQKKKLQELHKKSLQLLAQNVRAKRERSKSRDKNTYVRPQETNSTNNIRKARSMDRINSAEPGKQKNKNLLYPPSPDYKNRTAPSVKGTSDKSEPEKIVILARNTTRGGGKIEKPEIILNKTINKMFSPEKPLTKQESQKETIEDIITNISNKKITPRKLFGDLDDTEIPQSLKISGDPVKNILDYKSPLSFASNITIRSPRNFEAEKVNPTDTPKEDRGALDVLKKNSKEIQTEVIEKDYPKWLEEQPPQAYPFNFINTVTRKLQVANNQKSKTDVGVQNSLMTPVPIEKTETLERAKKNLKSFISQTCMNLDPAGIEHLELVPKFSTQLTETGSESDTSKNIPEISSESGTSLKKNKESVRKALTLNRNKIDNMKLVPNNVSATRSNKSQLSVENPYVSDFDSDGDKSADKSRNSIISFNRSQYNKVIVSNPESLSDVSTSRRTVSTVRTETKENKDELSSSKSKKPLNAADSNSDDQIVTSSKNSGAGTEVRLSSSISTNLSTSSKNINTQRGSTSLNEDILPLSEPKATLTRSPEKKGQTKEKNSHVIKNFSVRSSKVSTKTDGKDANQIHLKFEAEIHLLNDFNESLKKFSALEQALETLKTNNTLTSKNIGNAVTKIGENEVRSKSQISQINFSRGSFINSSIGEDLNNLANSVLDKDDTSVISTGLEVSNLNLIDQSMSVRSEEQFSNFENIQSVNFAGLSLNMFEQLIKDEDARLENLKTILKIREKALLDRTKGELAWLEIQRKHFKETGKLQEASVVKKKQRAILVNHQKEKHEMQRLKQMQKAASIERKIVLKGQRNLIRQKLSTDYMLTKMKVNVPKERRSSGPLKVLQSHTESVRSETSITKRSSSERERDVLSITSHHSATHHSIVSEISEIEVPSLERQNSIKRTLLMREEALKKRRKAAEELLQWHTKLLEEEKRIAVLESAASAIISRKPAAKTDREKYDFKGKQLNQLWSNLTGSEAKKFVDDKIYPMSQLTLERFCKSAREYSIKTKRLLKKSEETTSASYASDFECSPVTEEQDVVDQSIDILINNFNQIQDDISTLNLTQSRKSDDNKEIVSDIESSQIYSDSEELKTSVVEIVTNSGSSNRKMIDNKVSESIVDTLKTEECHSNDKVEEEPHHKQSQEGTLLPKSLTKFESIEHTSKIVTERSLEDSSVLETHTNRKTEENVEELDLDGSLKTFSAHKTLVGEEIRKVDEESDRQDSSAPKTHTDNEFTEENDKIEEINGKTDSSVIKIITDSKSTEETNKIREISLGPTKIITDIKATEEIEELESSSVLKTLIESKSTEETDNIKEISEELVKTLTDKEYTDEMKELDYQGSVEISSVHKTLTDNKCTEETDKVKEISDALAKTLTDKESTDKIEELDRQVSLEVSSVHKDLTDNSCTEQTDKINEIREELVETLMDKESAEEIEEEQSLATPIAQKTFANNESIEDNFNVEDLVRNGSLEISTAVKTLKNDECIEEVEEVISANQIEETILLPKENLNESQEILSILGETEPNNGEEEVLDFRLKDNLTESEEILSKLSQIVQDEEVLVSTDSQKSSTETTTGSPLTTEDVTDQDMLSESLLKLYVIGESDKGNRLLDTSGLEQSITDEDSGRNKQDLERAEDKEIVGKLVIEVEEKKGLFDSIIDEFKEGKKVVADPIIEEQEEEIESDKSNDSFIINDVQEEAAQKRDEYSQKSEKLSEEETIKTEESSSKERTEQISNLSYGVIEEKSRSEKRSEKEEVCYEEKEHDSLSSLNGAGSSSDLSSSLSEIKDKVDVKKRVSEIMADTSLSRGEKSPRLQDLYVTTYDLISPANSPEKAPSSPIEEHKLVSSIFHSEAEELLRKQLAVEQEIKAITEQQKEQQLPLMYIREIPNKPPPPYTPPSPMNQICPPTIIPTVEEIEEITMYSAKILHKAYLSNNLTNVTISNTTLSLISKTISKDCYKFVFNLCKEIAREHYRKFEEDDSPFWLRVPKKLESSLVKPFDTEGLKFHMIKKLKEVLGYQKPPKRENANVKWIRKKRDHVDEILVAECQQEESQWTNYEKDELLVEDKITNEILDSLLIDTAEVYEKIFLKRKFSNIND